VVVGPGRFIGSEGPVMKNLSCDDICNLRQLGGGTVQVLREGYSTTTAAMLAITFVLWPASAFAQVEHLTHKSWTACPTIEATNEMLIFDGDSAVCERIKAASRMIVERNEQAPATRWMCIDHPIASGTFTLCNWQTFRDELNTWLCARSPNTAGPCKWGPAEYFTEEPILAEVP
jgi:hypothetical protein